MLYKCFVFTGSVVAVENGYWDVSHGGTKQFDSSCLLVLRMLTALYNTVFVCMLWLDTSCYNNTGLQKQTAVVAYLES